MSKLQSFIIAAQAASICASVGQWNGNEYYIPEKKDTFGILNPMASPGYSKKRKSKRRKAKRLNKIKLV